MKKEEEKSQQYRDVLKRQRELTKLGVACSQVDAVNVGE